MRMAQSEFGDTYSQAVTMMSIGTAGAVISAVPEVRTWARPSLFFILIAAERHGSGQYHAVPAASVVRPFYWCSGSAGSAGPDRSGGKAWSK